MTPAEKRKATMARRKAEQQRLEGVAERLRAVLTEFQAQEAVIVRASSWYDDPYLAVESPDDPNVEIDACWNPEPQP